MKNQTPKQVYLQQLESIRQRKCSYSMRIKLLQGLVEKLKTIEHNPELASISVESKKCFIQSADSHKSMFAKRNTPSEYQSTSHSFFSDQQSFIDNTPSSSQEYEQKIMQKRVIKFEINEQIEALEDDLFQIQKVTDTKRTLNDQLAKHIQKRMKEIGQKSHDKKTKQEGFMFTSFSGAFRTKKKQQGYSIDMNATISGASGFGMSYYKGKEVSGNIATIRNQTDSNNMNEDSSESPQRKKAKSHYLGKSITGIFKNILK